MNKQLLQNEPVLTRSIIQIVMSIIALFGAFGLKLEPEQTAAILALLNAILPLAFGFWMRNHVTPVANPRDNEGRQLLPYPDGEQWQD